MRAGFSLIEAIIALVLLAIGVLGAAAAGLLALRMLRDAETLDEVSSRAPALLDSLIADSVIGRGYTVTARYSIGWTASGDSAAVTVRTADSATFTLRAVR